MKYLYILSFSQVKFIIAISIFSFFLPLDGRGQGDPFNCVSNTYLFQYNDVYSVDLSSGNSFLEATDVTPGNINAAAYNPADGFLWGALSTPDKAIVKIGNNFSTETFIISQLPSNNPYVGDISQAGIYYLKPGGSTYYTIDLNPASPNYTQFIGSQSLSQNILVHDWAFNALDNKLYAVEKNTNHLYTIDPGTGLVTDLGLVPILDGLSYTYGAVYFDAAGNFYISANQTGTIYIVTSIQDIPTNGINSNLFAYGPSSASNDGARCPTASVPIENCSNGVDDDGDGLVDCDDPACSGVSSCPVLPSSGGNSGGLDSNNRLSEKITKRNFRRAKTNHAFEKSITNRIRKQDKSDQNKTGIIKLSDLIPIDLIANSSAHESSPADLAAITNASEVYSVDYFKDEIRIAAIMALKTNDAVYEHSKYICDRLLGGELLNVSTIEINEQYFTKSLIKQPDGQQEFVLSFSARVEDDAFSIESHWNIDKYSPANEYFNFQIWANSVDDLLLITKEILDVLDERKPIIEYLLSPPPQVFVKKAKYQNGSIKLDIANHNFSEKLEIRGGTKRAESDDIEEISFQYDIKPTKDTFKMETGYLFDMGFRVSSDKQGTPDDLFLSDGPWGLDDSAESSIIDEFRVHQHTEKFRGSGFPVERNISFSGSSREYVSIYRALNPRFMSVNLSDYNTLQFNASGIGTLEITIIKESIDNWEEQMKTEIILNEQGSEFQLHCKNFVTENQNSCDFSDIKMIVFSFSSPDGQQKDFNLELSALEFTLTDYEVSQTEANESNSIVVPNPIGDIGAIYFRSNDSSVYYLDMVNPIGQTVYSTQGQTVKGLNNIPISNENLSSGNYAYRITTNTGQLFAGKIVVMK
jgi:hypothetical protein